MECPRRWATLYLLIYLSLYVANGYCQSIPLERKAPEVSTQPPSLSKSQLINALFTYASAKGLLPKTTQIMQTASQEQPQITTMQHTPNMFNVPIQPQISSNCENRPIVSINSNPTLSLTPILNQVSPPTTTSYSPSTILQPTVKIDPISWGFPKTYQVGCFENFANVQPSHTVWNIPQPALPITPINSCTTNQPMVCNEANPYADSQKSSPTCILPTMNTESRSIENVCKTNFRHICEEPLVVTSHDTPGLPINLQINLPSPNDLDPRIIVVSAVPSISEPASTYSPYAVPPPVPIIIKRSRSCLQKLLPIILLALIGDGGGCGGCGCNCDSDDHIPIPYPIPIPINNPIISSTCNSPYSSRNRKNKDIGK